MDRGAQWATVHGVAKNETQLNEYFAVVQWLVMSDFLHPHELQHVRIPCPSLSPGVCANSCPLSQWSHPTISFSVTLFFSCPQSLPAPGSFPTSWLFTSGGRSIGASASASVLPMNIQHWFPLRFTGLISLLSKGLSRVFFQHHNSEASVLRCSAFFMVQLSHLYVITGKTIASTRQTFVSKVMSLPFNMLSRFVIAFLARKHLLILWLQSPSRVILESRKIKSVTVSTFPPSICHGVMGPKCYDLSFLSVEF